jgi:hypothetical protein
MPCADSGVGVGMRGVGGTRCRAASAAGAVRRSPGAEQGRGLGLGSSRGRGGGSDLQAQGRARHRAGSRRVVGWRLGLASVGCARASRLVQERAWAGHGAGSTAAWALACRGGSAAACASCALGAVLAARVGRQRGRERGGRREGEREREEEREGVAGRRQLEMSEGARVGL